MNRSLLPITMVAALWQIGCHSETHHKEERIKLPVTHPLRADAELTKEYVCQIRSIMHIELRALEKGYLRGIFVDEGKFVTKGQRMFQVMPLLYDAEYQKAQAEAEAAQIEYENTKRLADKDVVSSAELALAQAKRKRARANAELAQAHLHLTEIRAPFDGFMGRLRVRQGSLLGEGELLTTLADNSQMWVYFNVSESDYLDYKASPAAQEGPATVRLRMANDKLFPQPGKVETIEADFDNKTGNIAFRATFPNPQGILRHGETGTVLMTTSLKNALIIPQKATFELLTKRYVFVVDDKSVVHMREVTIAEELPHRYIVAKGLSTNDKILLEGLRRVNNGDQIAVDLQDPSRVLAQLELPVE